MSPFDDNRPRASTLTWPERLENYRRVMRDEPYMVDTNTPQDWDPDIAINGRWLFGYWFLGQSWRVKSGYHGGYPGNFLKRIAALFPDKHNVLHLFAGKVDLSVLPGETVDLRPEMKPTYCTNCETLADVPLAKRDLVVADPPYTEEDANKYGVPMVNRDRVMRALAALSPGCHVVWLDMALPRYRKDVFRREAAIGVSRSTGHRFRSVNIFSRL